ncbi:MAG: hypothetical protein KDK70_01640 [Myxococcales bacterium]|nr:hypothetical protein [Myxococcales bacterium]
MRWLALLLLSAACGDDSSGDTTLTGFGTSPPATSTSGSASGSASGTTSDDPTATADTGEPTSSSGAADTTPSTTTGLDCAAPADCEACWQCAVTEGPCAAGYDACLANINCAGSMVCIESTCTEGALQQSCLDTCCMSCTNLGTCGMVDPTVQCVATECAALCGAPTCP